MMDEKVLVVGGSFLGLLLLVKSWTEGRDAKSNAKGHSCRTDPPQLCYCKCGIKTS